MKKKLVSTMLAVMMGLSLTACGSGGDDKPATDGGNTATEDNKDDGAADDGAADDATDGNTADDNAADSGSSAEVANKDKPLVWFNRQPSNSSTGELDMAALTFNDNTYYVGFDANQGAELQGTMVRDYIEANIDKIDRNGDGVIGYVLAIGDIGHNDSIARTRGIRKALGTGVEKDGDINSDPIGTNTDGSASAVQDGSIEVGGKKYVVRELASQEMKNSAGLRGMLLRLVMQSVHGLLHLVKKLILLHLTMMVWACPCLMHGLKTIRYRLLVMMLTVMQWQRSQKAMAERSASMRMCRHI